MVLARFAEFANYQRRHDLPEKVRSAAVGAAIDWFAATVAGAGMSPAVILREAVDAGRFEVSVGPCRLIPDGTRMEARTAALINGTASHTAELDDIYRDGLYHPGSPTVAAALAVAEYRHASGSELLRGIAIGYEIGDRIAASVQPAHYRYWHTTGTVGTIGAAAAAAEVLGLVSAKFTHALATATTMAAGLQQAFRSDAMSKPLHAGRAAEAGVLAALAAERGLTGASDVLDGEAGFGPAMAEEPEWSTALDGLGERDWCVTQATVKNHACCGHTFAAVDATLAARDAGVQASGIRSLHVATYGTALAVAGDTAPVTPFECKFSIPYCVAAALLWGSVRLRAFDDDAVTDAGVRALMDKVSLSVDPAAEERFPRQRGARVTITCADGVEHVQTRMTRKGDPDDPLTETELREKFRELTDRFVGAERTSALEQGLMTLPELADVAELPGLGQKQ